MSINREAKPARKKPGLYKWLAAAASFLFLLFLYQLLGPNPPIIVSPQTTYIIAPLLPNGLPDYEKYWLQQSRKGITSENNAAVLLRQALGPGDTSPADFDRISREIGAGERALDGNYLVDYYAGPIRRRVAAWMNQQGTLTLNGKPPNAELLEEILAPAPASTSPEYDQLYELVEAEIERVVSHPWTADQAPPIAA